MDAVVQLIRNALCTTKNFNVFSDTFLYNPKVTSQYYNFPPPLNQTTPLEILISITQFYAFVSVSLAGYGLITRKGIRKLQLISRLLDVKVNSVNENKKDSKDDKIESITKSAARRLVKESLLQERDSATRSFFIGVNVLAIGIAFFWLFANSFHVTSTNWIGGISGLIHALAVMEVCLVFLLYYMIKDGSSYISKSFRMQSFVSKISTCDVDNISLEQYCWMVDGWNPFWVEGNSAFSAEEKMLLKEEEAVAFQIGLFFKKVDSNISNGIRLQSRIALFEGYREYTYFILNFFAFYGYFASILVFYFHDETSQPSYIRAMLFHLPNSEADWLGNAVGDFAWTLEPIVILTSPTIIHLMKMKRLTKEKEA